MEEMVCLNGTLVPKSEARILPSDQGFLHAYGLFETMRAYGGKVFRLARHLDRLEQGVQALDMPAPPKGTLETAVQETLRANRLTNARIRLTVTAGEDDMRSGATCEHPTVLVTALHLEPPAQDTYQNGYRTIISNIRRNSQSPLARVKSLSHLDNVLARREALAKGADEAVMLNEKLCVAEGSSSNLFFVAHGGVFTPSLDCGVLPGITRETVIEIAAHIPLPVEERWIAMEEVWDAEEAFLTGSVVQVMPLTSVNGRHIGGGAPGPVTQRLMAGYAELVRKELGLE